MGTSPLVTPSFTGRDRFLFFSFLETTCSIERQCAGAGQLAAMMAETINTVTTTEKQLSFAAA